jgi:hypothetical protein
MLCRSCGIEIADKALICYRCGTATTEAKYKPAPIHSRRITSGSLIAAIVLILFALGGLSIALTTADDTVRLVASVVAALAATIVVLRGVIRRR